MYLCKYFRLKNAHKCKSSSQYMTYEQDKNDANMHMCTITASHTKVHANVHVYTLAEMQDCIYLCHFVHTFVYVYPYVCTCAFWVNPFQCTCVKVRTFRPLRTHGFRTRCAYVFAWNNSVQCPYLCVCACMMYVCMVARLLCNPALHVPWFSLIFIIVRSHGFVERHVNDWKCATGLPVCICDCWFLRVSMCGYSTAWGVLCVDEISMLFPSVCVKMQAFKHEEPCSAEKIQDQSDCRNKGIHLT